jgi:hypothetical protein
VHCSQLGTSLNNLCFPQKVQRGTLLAHVDVDQGENLQNTGDIYCNEDDDHHSVSKSHEQSKGSINKYPY